MSNEQAIPLVLALDDASATLEQVGGKGASLARMAAAGLPVPAGFHVTTAATTAAYRRFVTENHLTEAILLAAAQPSEDAAAAQIQPLIAQSRRIQRAGFLVSLDSEN